MQHQKKGVYMFKLIRWFLWGLFLLLLIATVDQVLLRVALPVPGYGAVQIFYTDFRSRLFGLATKDPIAAKIPHTKETSSQRAASPASKKKIRYLYADGEGALQFADSLDDVPLQYRKNAQPLAE
jgi:hypothetical protein